MRDWLDDDVDGCGDEAGADAARELELCRRDQLPEFRIEIAAAREPDECLGVAVLRFEAAVQLGDLAPVPNPDRVEAFVTGHELLLVFDEQGRKVDVVRGVEPERLRTHRIRGAPDRAGLEAEKLGVHAELQTVVEHHVRRGSMIRVNVHGPVREHDVGIEALERPGQHLPLGVRRFRPAVRLVHEERNIDAIDQPMRTSALFHPAIALRRIIGERRDERQDFMPRAYEQSEQTSHPALDITRVSRNDQNLLHCRNPPAPCVLDVSITKEPIRQWILTRFRTPCSPPC